MPLIGYVPAQNCILNRNLSKTKQITTSMTKNNDHSSKVDAAKIMIIWPNESNNKTYFGK